MRNEYFQRFLRTIQILLSNKTKKIKLLKNKNKKQTKRKNNIKTVVVGVTEKAGVTHLCLAIANFIGSVLRRKVIYIEYSASSKLLSIVGQNPVKIGESQGYKYKGVYYVLTNEEKEVLSLLRKEKAWIIIDLEKLDESTLTIFNCSDNKLVVGFSSPWCQNDYLKFLNLLKNYVNDIDQIRYLRRNKEKIKTDYRIELAPYIEDPFLLKEEELEPLFNLIK